MASDSESSMEHDEETMAATPLLSSITSTEVRSIHARFNRKCPVTVEPVIILYFISVMASTLTDTQFYYAYYANDAGIPSTQDMDDEICSANRTTADEDAAVSVQKQTARVQLYCNMALYLAAIPTAILMGAYSDKAGRKIGLLLPLAGYAMRQFSFVVIAYNKWNVMFCIGANLLEGITSGGCSFLMASFAYLSDITTAEQRPTRLVIAEIAIGVSVIISSLGSGVLITAVGFYYSYFISFTMGIIGFIYVITLLPETIAMRPGVKFFTFKSFGILYDFFTNPSVSTRRWQLNINLVMFFLWMIVDVGLLNVQILRVIAYPICLHSIGIGFFIGEAYMLKNIGSFIALKLFHKCIGNNGLLLLGMFSGLAALISFASVESVELIFIFAALGCCTMLATGMIRTNCSHLVQPNRLGSLFALIAIEQQLSLLLASTLWNSVYEATVAISPALVFYIAAGACAILPLPLAIYQVLYGSNTIYYQETYIETTPGPDAINSPAQ